MEREIYKVTEAFERELCRYTGAPYAVAVDSCSNALFLALTYDNIKGKTITIPSHTYPGVPCAIIHAGGKVGFFDSEKTLKGGYWLHGSNVLDCALTFTSNMYIHPNTYMCLSFSGPYKRLKLGKGGAILTDNKKAYKWFKRARFSGRGECSYHDDKFTQLGWNMYLLPELAVKGLREMRQFYNHDGTPKQMPDLELPYPDLSVHKIYTQ